MVQSTLDAIQTALGELSATDCGWNSYPSFAPGLAKYEICNPIMWHASGQAPRPSRVCTSQYVGGIKPADLTDAQHSRCENGFRRKGSNMSSFLAVSSHAANNWGKKSAAAGKNTDDAGKLNGDGSDGADLTDCASLKDEGSDDFDSSDSGGTDSNGPDGDADPSKCVTSCDLVPAGRDCKKCNPDGSAQTESQKEVEIARMHADNAPGTGVTGAPGSCPGKSGQTSSKAVLEDQKNRRLSDVMPVCDGARLRSIAFCRRPAPWLEAAFDGS